MNISGIAIGAGHPCRTIAEVSNNHNGSLDRAKRIITAAKEAGADFVKLQCYTPAELVALRGDGPAPDPWGADGWTMEKLYEKAQTPHAWFPALAAHADAVGIPWFSSVFGPISLALLESLDCPAYKISAIDAGCGWLRRMVHDTGKPWVVSFRPGADDAGGHMRCLCPPGYPQDNPALGALREWKGYAVDGKGANMSLTPRPVFGGYSYHGTDPEIPALAALVGAKLVECHFALDDEPSELEADVSLSASAFANMVERIRYYEGLL